MEIDKYTAHLNKLDACREAVEWSKQFKTSQEAWEACQRGDWMLWLVGKHAGKPWSNKRKPLVSASCKCVRLVWDLMKQPSKECIILFERWANGEGIPKVDLLKARRTAAAYSAADAAYAAYAACAAADAYAAAYAACAAYAAARNKTLSKCAGIVKEFYPNIDDVIK